MNEFLSIEVGDKEYFLGFPNRNSIRRAEANGLNLMDAENKLITFTSMLFFTALLEKQPNMTLEEADEILDKYDEEYNLDPSNKPSINEITQYLGGQYSTFIKPPVAKKKTKLKIVKM